MLLRNCGGMAIIKSVICEDTGTEHITLNTTCLRFGMNMRKKWDTYLKYMCVCVCVRERERQRQRETERGDRDRETERDTHRERLLKPELAVFTL